MMADAVVPPSPSALHNKITGSLFFLLHNVILLCVAGAWFFYYLPPEQVLPSSLLSIVYCLSRVVFSDRPHRNRRRARRPSLFSRAADAWPW